jgi:multidrug efflux pump subunit AcrA (membrane-fusion protein)
MQRELRRIVALAERLEEDDAARAKRLAAEAQAEKEAASNAEMQRAWAVQSAQDKARKAAIRQAVTDAARDAWGERAGEDCGADCDNDDCENVEHLLDDLFDDYDTYEDFKGDSVEIVAKMCAELGLKPAADAFDEPAPADIDPAVVEQARTLELARGYLERTGWMVEPAPVQDGHAPPDG